MVVALGALIALFVVFAVASLRVIPAQQRAVVFQLGRFLAVRGPGLILVMPLIQSIVKVDLGPIALDLPPQDVDTRGNESVNVALQLQYRVLDPAKAVNEVADVRAALVQLAQTGLRTVLRSYDVDGLLAGREKVAAEIRDAIDAAAAGWGVKIASVEIKHVDLKVFMAPSKARASAANAASATRGA